MRAKEDLSHAISAKRAMSVQQIRRLSLRRGVRKDIMLLSLASLPVLSAQPAQSALIQLLSLHLVKWANMLQRQAQVKLR